MQNQRINQRIESGCFATLDLTPNRIEQVRQQVAGAGGYLDLTSSNPTHQGLLFPPEILSPAAHSYLTHRRYDPNPHGLPAARTAIVHFYTTRTPPLHLSEDAIFLTASTSEAYSLLFALLTNPGDNVLAPDVTYPLFEYFSELHRVELRPYHLDEERGWQIDEDSLVAQADERTRAVLIVSPHNPTGAVVQQPIAALSTLGLPLICDEVFASFPYRAPTIPPIGALHPELPVFHLNGISKMFALPDLKLGWIALNEAASGVSRPHRWAGSGHQSRYSERLELINDTFLGANSLTQTLLPTLFEQGGPFIASMQAHIRENLDFACSRCRTMCPSLHITPPDAGYYLFPRVRRDDDELDEEELVISLLKQGVLVHPGYFYGEPNGTHLLLSALTQPETFRCGVERLCQSLSTLL
jgi:aspartate/methionine/tyrosine aminotransferase